MESSDSVSKFWKVTEWPDPEDRVWSSAWSIKLPMPTENMLTPPFFAAIAAARVSLGSKEIPSVRTTPSLGTFGLPDCKTSIIFRTPKAVSVPIRACLSWLILRKSSCLSPCRFTTSVMLLEKSTSPSCILSVPMSSCLVKVSMEALTFSKSGLLILSDPSITRTKSSTFRQPVK